MKFQITPNPWLKTRTQYIVSRRTSGQNIFNLFGWYNWMFWGLTIIVLVGEQVFNFIITPDYFHKLELLDWIIVLWGGTVLPTTLKQFYYWFLSRGASNAPLHKIVEGYNAGPMEVELTENKLIMTRPLEKETIDWSVLTNVFEYKNKIYIASGHNPILTLPADKEIRQFFLNKGYLT